MLLKCIEVNPGFARFFTEGKVYRSDEISVEDDSVEPTEDRFEWDLESEFLEVRSICFDQESDLVAKFEIVEE